MKLAFTLSDCSLKAANAGNVEYLTFVVDVPDEIIPDTILRYVAAQYKPKGDAGGELRAYRTMVISVVGENRISDVDNKK